jgi:hypothetical protein
MKRLNGDVCLCQTAHIIMSEWVRGPERRTDNGPGREKVCRSSFAHGTLHILSE